MTPEELRERTLTFAVSIHRSIKPLMSQPDLRHVATQLFRASSSVAANYRAAGLGRSRKEFAAKLGTVAEEADESLFWLTFLDRARMVPASSQIEFASLSKEADALARIFVAAYRTARRRLLEEKRRKQAERARARSRPTDSPIAR